MPSKTPQTHSAPIVRYYLSYQGHLPAVAKRTPEHRIAAEHPSRREQ